MISMLTIGRIPLGVDGFDEYVLVTDTEDVLTPDAAHQWLLPQVYRQTTQPAGGYFCTSVLAMQHAYRDNACLCVIQHRYDV